MNLSSEKSKIKKAPQKEELLEIKINVFIVPENIDFGHYLLKTNNTLQLQE